jgi:hypothetical protein
VLLNSGEFHMKRSLKITMLALLLTQATSSYAFDLIGGLISAGTNAVGSIGKAAYNKVTEDSPEQAAAKQQKAEADAIAAYKKAQAKVEERPGLTPLQREHTQIALNSQYQMGMEYLAAQTEREKAQREANNNALSGAGIMGTVGSSLTTGAMVAVSPDNPMNMSDKELIARGRSMSQAAQPAINAATQQPSQGGPNSNILAQVASGSNPTLRPIGKDAMTMDQRAAAMDTIEQQTGIAEYRKLQQEMATRVVDYAVTKASDTSFMLDQDKGRKVYAEFIGSPKLTAEIQAALRKSEFNVVDKSDDADVQYQFQGDYALAATHGYTGTEGNAGEIFEGKAVPAPEKKSQVASMARGFLGALAGMKMQAPIEDETFRQQALIVVNRHADGKDVRASSFVTGQSKDVQATGMVNMALVNLYVKVGLPGMDVSKLGLGSSVTGTGKQSVAESTSP